MQVPLPPSDSAPAKMAIGGQDGFRVNDADRFKTIEEQCLVVMPQQLEVALPNPELPTIVLDATAAITVRIVHLCALCMSLGAEEGQTCVLFGLNCMQLAGPESCPVAGTRQHKQPGGHLGLRAAELPQLQETLSCAGGASWT